nr:MAG TPA: hypothetical protein [Caudoviricetes sp.]
MIYGFSCLGQHLKISILYCLNRTEFLSCV